MLLMILITYKCLWSFKFLSASKIKIIKNVHPKTLTHSIFHTEDTIPYTKLPVYTTIFIIYKVAIISTFLFKKMPNLAQNGLDIHQCSEQ